MANCIVWYQLISESGPSWTYRKVYYADGQYANCGPVRNKTYNIYVDICKMFT
jgi:hypothetical protein